MSDSIAKRYGLPENLRPEEVAQALEDAASEIRRGESHDGWLAQRIAITRATSVRTRRRLSAPFMVVVRVKNVKLRRASARRPANSANTALPHLALVEGSGGRAVLETVDEM